MREDYWIFVEGVADKRFLEQLIEYHWGKAKRESRVPPGGYTYLLSGTTYLKLMHRN